MAIPPDLRPRFFAGLEWYDTLSEPPRPGPSSAWYLAKDPEPEWYVQTLNASLAFAVKHGLEANYRQRFAAISPQSLLPERAKAESRATFSPIWNVANELLVGLLLETVAGWRYRGYEPRGRGAHKGEWEFLTPSNRVAFIEVKSFAEPELDATGPHNRPDYRPEVREQVRRAYKQLPQDGRATVLFLVGKEIPRIPFGIMHGSIFEAMFGQYQVRFNVAAKEPSITYTGPSFREMTVHGGKHTRLGCIVGLHKRGLTEPGLHLYVIHNPYALEPVRTPPSDWGTIHQFVVDEEGRGTDQDGMTPADLWALASQ